VSEAPERAIGAAPGPASLPGPNCPLCPRLAGFRATQRDAHPDWHNAPVPPFGGADAELLIVGLAPGLRGANRTGRPFTGDYAGDLLYATLAKFGLAAGTYAAHRNDGLTLARTRITNAVRCVPPQNKPDTPEITACRPFLAGELASLSNLRAIVALGSIAHNAVLTAKALRRPPYPFAHAAIHALPDGTILIDSYHCSRLNTNTGRLTPAMFEAVFESVLERLR
jgi:uracil-DNA glycosylase